MNVIFSAFILIIGICWAMLTTLAGLLFIPILLIMAAIGIPVRSSSTTTSSTPIPDHHVHVPIDSVPPMYYSAYSDYLKSPEWRAFRKLVLKRDKYRCVDCGVPAYHKDICPTGSRLQVHHIHYDGIDTMTFTIDQCVSVCKQCHDIRHGR